MKKKTTPKLIISEAEIGRGYGLRILKDNSETDPAWVRLAAAVAEIVTNNATPVKLYNPVMDFLTSGASGGLLDRIIVTAPIIQSILVEASLKQKREEADDDEN